MKGDNVTILHIEYPMFRDERENHVLMTALAVMYKDFTDNEKFYTMEAGKHHEILKLFMEIQKLLSEAYNRYERQLGSASLMEIEMTYSVYPLFEMLFYETEYQVKISIAPLKILSDNEQRSLDMIEHFQRYNKTTQQIREEKIDKLID